MHTKTIAILSIVVALLFASHTIGKSENVNFPKPSAIITQSSDTSFPICIAPDDQGFARPIYNKKDEEYLIVWKDYRDSGVASLETPGVIYGQRISLVGDLLGDEIAISTENPEIIRYMPTSSYDPIKNEYLVVYLKDWDIYGQFINSEGSFRGEEFIICDAEGQQMHPAIEYNPTNRNYFIIWNDRRKGPGEADIYGAFINSDGNLDGDEFLVCDEPKDQFAPSMAYNSVDDEFLVTYEDFQTCIIEPCYSDVSSLYGKRVSIDGAFLGETFLITTGGYDSRQQNLSHNPNRNEYMIAWNDKRNQGDEPNIDIYGRKIGSEGTLLGEDFPICTAPNEQGYCTVPYDPFNKIYLMVWNDFRNIEPQSSLYFKRSSIQPTGGATLYGYGTAYARWYNDDGEPLGAEFPICEVSMGQQMLAKARYYVTGKNKGTFFVVWTDMRNEETVGDIYGKFLQAPQCLATRLLQDETSLNFLRQLRDNILSRSQKGKNYINLYYKYAQDIFPIISSNKKTKRATQEVFLEGIPIIASLLKGEKASVNATYKRKINNLLAIISSKADVNLKSAITEIQKDICKGEIFKEFDINVE